jgi:hypothetical protein
MQLRVLRRPAAPLPLHHHANQAISVPHFRPFAGPYRYSYRSPVNGVPGNCGNTQQRRFKHYPGTDRKRPCAAAKAFCRSKNLLNARMSDRQLKSHCLLDDDSRQLIEMAVDKLGLSVRAYTRILKVARTIADLEGANNIEASHIAEAIQYRSLDRRMI